MADHTSAFFLHCKKCVTTKGTDDIEVGIGHEGIRIGCKLCGTQIFTIVNQTDIDTLFSIAGQHGCAQCEGEGQDESNGPAESSS